MNPQFAGLSIGGVCLEFRIIDPDDGWMFRIRSMTNIGAPQRWKIEACAAQTIDWLGLDTEVNEFDDFEEAYLALDNYMQARWQARWPN